MTLVFGILRPYRTDVYNRLDCTYFGLLAFTRLFGICGEYIIHNIMLFVSVYLYGDSSTYISHNFCSFNLHSFTHY